MQKYWLKIIGFIGILIPQLGQACAVCYGNSESNLTQGVNIAIITLIGITGGVMSGLVAFVLNMQKRSRIANASDNYSRNQTEKEGRTP